MPLHQVGVLLDDQDVVTAGVEVRGDGRAHAAGSGDGHLHDRPSLGGDGDVGPSAGRAGSGAGRRPDGRSRPRQGAVGHHRWRTSPSWPTRSAKSSRTTPARVTATTVTSPGTDRSARRLPAQRSGSSRSTSDSVPVGSVHSRLDLVGQQAPPDLVDGPRHRGHGGDAQPQVDLGPPGVVDPGHHVGDLVGLPGDAGGEDVGVVAAGHGGQGVGLAGPGPVEVVAVEARSDHVVPGQSGGQAAEGLGVPVDDGHRVALLGQPHGQARPDPTASHDDDVHPHHATRIVGRITTHPRRSRAARGPRWPGHPSGSASGEAAGAHDLLKGWSLGDRRCRSGPAGAGGSQTGLAPPVPGARMRPDGARPRPPWTSPRRSATG